MHKKISNADTYLHMDHTSQRDKITEYPALLCSCLVEKQQQCSLSLLQTLICPGSNQVIERQIERHRERACARKRERETTSVTWAACTSAPCLSLALSLCFYVCVSFSPSSGAMKHTLTHIHTLCSLRHKGPHGNGAFRSPVALFMQRCITMGPPTGTACQKSPPLASHSLWLSLSLSFSLSRPSAPPPSLIHHHWKARRDFGRRRAEEPKDGEEVGWRKAHTHTHTLCSASVKSYGLRRDVRSVWGQKSALGVFKLTQIQNRM